MNTEKINQKIVFNLPEEITTIDVIDEILKSHGLEENSKDFFNKIIAEEELGKESKVSIIKDVAVLIVQKKIPENKIVELLGKHLEIPQETAEKIIQDIKEKLVPYAKVIDLEKESIERERRKQEAEKQREIEYKKEKIQEELLDKIRGNAPAQEHELEELPEPAVKKVDITDVEKNAEKIKRDRRPIISTTKKQESLKETPKENKPDPYKEPIE